MNQVSSFSDYFLIKAASQYVYEISFFAVYKDPVLTVTMNLKNDFLNRYIIERCENEAFIRDDQRINLRYILFKDTLTDEYALVYQGSIGEMSDMFSGEDNDWSNNLNIVAQLPLLNYDLAKAEFEYLRDEGYNITAVSGNSLGGGYALYIGDFYKDVRAIGLNPAPREFSARFKEDSNADVVLISSDILSRTLSLDIVRLEGEQSISYQKNRSTFDRMKDAYGIKPYVIKRSIPYTSAENISIGHVGAMRNYRKFILKIYNDDFLYYNAKIIKEHKEWKSFSKYLIQTAYRKLEQTDYRAFTEDYIYPSLSENAKGIVNTYMYYPQIDDFTSFDLKTMNLIKDHKNDDEYVIEDHFMFINNLNLTFEGYRKTKAFFINNSLYELQTLNDDLGFSYTKKKFISSSLKLSLDWDWMFAKIFIDMPLPVKIKTGEFLEQNISFVYRLNNKLNEEYMITEMFSEDEINAYVSDLIQAFIKLRELNENIKGLSETLSNNLELMFIEGRNNQLIKTEVYEAPSKLEVISFDNLSSLNKHIIKHHFEAAKETLKNSEDFVEESVIDIAASLTKVLEVILTNLESEKEKREDERLNKLYMQTEALLKKVDLKSFLVMALYEYQDDLVVYLLRDSVAITIQYNLIQMLEANDQYKLHLKNLNKYLKINLSKTQYELLHHDLLKLEDLIKEEDEHLKNILM